MATTTKKITTSTVEAPAATEVTKTTPSELLGCKDALKLISRILVANEDSAQVVEAVRDIVGSTGYPSQQAQGLPE